VKSYQQYCALAMGLDVMGDRWSMLILRELSLRDCRYTDIQDGLPGIASNLLAERLRDLQANGIVERYNAPKPVASPLYRLTTSGHELLPALYGIVRWASPLMVSGPTDGDQQKSRWTAFAAKAFLARSVPGAAPLIVRMDNGDEPVFIDFSSDVISVRLDSDDVADVRVSGQAWYQLGLISGELSFADASRLLEISGTQKSLRRFRAALQERRRMAADSATGARP
jgi:DNA-binding HxlR family transcriptional regulator